MSKTPRPHHLRRKPSKGPTKLAALDPKPAPVLVDLADMNNIVAALEKCGRGSNKAIIIAPMGRGKFYAQSVTTSRLTLVGAPGPALELGVCFRGENAAKALAALGAG